MNENQMQTILTYKNLLLHLGILLSGYLGVVGMEISKCALRVEVFMEF